MRLRPTARIVTHANAIRCDLSRPPMTWRHRSRALGTRSSHSVSRDSSWSPPSRHFSRASDLSNRTRVPHGVRGAPRTGRIRSRSTRRRRASAPMDRRRRRADATRARATSSVQRGGRSRASASASGVGRGADESRARTRRGRGASGRVRSHEPPPVDAARAKGTRGRDGAREGERTRGEGFRRRRGRHVSVRTRASAIARERGGGFVANASMGVSRRDARWRIEPRD